MLLETISHPNSSFEPKYNSSFVHPFSSHPLPPPPLSSPLTPRHSHISHLLLNTNLNPFSYIFSPPLNPSASLLVSISNPIIRLLPVSFSSPCPSPTLQFLSLLPFPSTYFHSLLPPSFHPSLPLYPSFLPFYFWPSPVPCTTFLRPTPLLPVLLHNTLKMLSVIFSSLR